MSATDGLLHPTAIEQDARKRAIKRASLAPQPALHRAVSVEVLPGTKPKAHAGKVLQGFLRIYTTDADFDGMTIDAAFTIEQATAWVLDKPRRIAHLEGFFEVTTVFTDEIYRILQARISQSFVGISMGIYRNVRIRPDAEMWAEFRFRDITKSDPTDQED